MPVQTVIDSQKNQIKAWLPKEEIEPQALQQLQNVADLPFVFKHVAAMPDVHLGIGATVGSVIATEKAIIPAAVGVDIGCGMMAVKIPLKAEVIQDKIKDVRHSIERSIPLGHNSNKRLTETVENYQGWKMLSQLKFVDQDLYTRAKHQLGSLGGGNHFVEICVDTDQAVWVMLHSGSRHIGKTLAQRYIEEAKFILKMNKEEFPDANLAYFKENSEPFQNYIAALLWCQDYAFHNRQEMMRRILKDLAYSVNGSEPLQKIIEVNCHHNYAVSERHFGRQVWVTRKGAVRAARGDLGIIPGSMGTRSYIVRGLGNPDSFLSCSHGAGRRMSRTEAKKKFSLEDLRQQTEGVECRKDQGVIDEIPGAYKDIDQVMKNQSDLVEVVAIMKQFLCIKG